jgi:hypothetical protein
MAEERISNELIYEVLKSIQGEIQRVNARLDRMERRLGNVEDLVGRLVQNDMNREREFTDLEARIARIEARLDLREADA